MIEFLDSHAHIFCSEYGDDSDVILQHAKDAGLTHLMCICCTLDEAERALKKQETEPFIDVAAGYHPEEADDVTNERLIQLEQLILSGKLKAVGEIGLDYYWRKDNIEKQKEIFIAQLKLAQKYQLPVIVHSRDAIMDTYNILKEYPVQRKGIIHCFSSSAEMAKEFVKLGYMIALGGPVTFKNAKVPKEVAKTVPLDYLLVETDCPYLTPTPHRGKRNEPMYIPFIAKEIANLREIDLKTLINAVQKNYQRLFSKD
ncbi:MAG: TatD family hydrolase [Erysipelotrichaceae bacterium]|nr:TatD family hydrolase [Erysipelotrichaceae bacterium]